MTRFPLHAGRVYMVGFVAMLASFVPSLAQAQTETIEYYGLDALGSVRVVFDASGNILGRMDYGPFGQELSSGTGLPSRAYAGLIRDGEAGLDHADARSYQSRTGRFSSVDPVYAGLFNPQGWNRYAYALNNPTEFVDPSGLGPCTLSNGQPGFCSGAVGADPYSASVASQMAGWWQMMFGPGGYVDQMRGRGTTASGTNASGTTTTTAPTPPSPPGPPPGPAPPPTPECKGQSATFFAQQFGPASGVGAGYDVDTTFLLGLSAHESGWGVSNMYLNQNNPFGFTPGGDRTGGIAFSSYASAWNAWGNQFGPRVRGVGSNVHAFLGNLLIDNSWQPRPGATDSRGMYNSLVKPGGSPEWASDVFDAIQSVTKRLSAWRMKCQ